MNPKYHLLVAAAALSLGACSTDDTDTVPENEGYKISFTVAENNETRTTFEMLEAGNFLRWVPTDEVGIYTVGKNENPNTKTVADVNQHPVEFIGTLNKLVSPGDMFYAYYPYKASQSTDPSAVTLSIPVEQKQSTAGVYNGESHPLVALPMAFPWERESKACRMSSVRFRQLGATVELQLYSSNEVLRSEKIRSVTFESETPLAGDFTFNLKTVADEAELKISGYESKTATSTLEEPAVIPATANEAARIYLTIAPGTYTGKIVVKTDVTQYTFNLTKAMTFERATIMGLPADLAEATRETPITENDLIHFEDQIVKEICTDNWDTDSDGELSYKEAAAVTSIGLKFQEASIRKFNELQYFTGVLSIEERAFYGCSSLTSIHLPDGVTTIEERAFYGCSSLTSIQIPDGVASIGMEAFSNCSSLTSINIPEGVTKIEDSAFNGCSSLTSINIPEGVTKIEDSAFNGCSSLTSIHLPDGVTTIAYGAFYGCSSLTSIQIPDGVASIGKEAFSNCSSLTSIHLPDGLIAIDRLTFKGCSSLTSINIPDGVTKIEDSAFYGCSSLTSITIPQKVTAISSMAFEGCSSLSAFYGKYASADHRCLIRYGTLLAFTPAGPTEYTIPDGVITISSFAFYGCRSLTSIHLPDGVTAIGNSAFKFCSSLTSINIPDGVTSIGSEAFSNCSSLTSINIPDGVTSIENRTFVLCSSLEGINIPNGVTSIGESAFGGCSGLTSFYCKPSTPPTLGSNALHSTWSSTKIYVPTASVEAYKTAEGWSKYASLIVADNN